MIIWLSYPFDIYHFNDFLIYKNKFLYILFHKKLYFWLI
ncbi:hypothetical protein SXCC_00029 [Gluconacetobacter sp. SXCC-1]|nr:hypothetical protein SXCC_00029 [Gluconacetobacter sp. SXCC-1]